MAEITRIKCTKKQNKRLTIFPQKENKKTKPLALANLFTGCATFALFFYNGFPVCLNDISFPISKTEETTFRLPDVGAGYRTTEC